METKKEILKWWEQRGTIETGQDDYGDFYEKVNKEKIKIIETQKGIGEKQEHKLVLMKSSWKYPIKLFFYNLECYRIEGF